SPSRGKYRTKASRPPSGAGAGIALGGARTFGRDRLPVGPELVDRFDDFAMPPALRARPQDRRRREAALVDELVDRLVADADENGHFGKRQHPVRERGGDLVAVVNELQGGAVLPDAGVASAASGGFGLLGHVHTLDFEPDTPEA